MHQPLQGLELPVDFLEENRLRDDKSANQERLNQPFQCAGLAQSVNPMLQVIDDPKQDQEDQRQHPLPAKEATQ